MSVRFAIVPLLLFSLFFWISCTPRTLTKVIAGKYQIDSISASTFVALDSAIVQGNIYSSEDGTCLANAAVYLKNLKLGVLTDSLGFFELNTPACKTQLIADYTGYSPLTTAPITLRQGTKTHLRVWLGTSFIYCE